MESKNVKKVEALFISDVHIGSKGSNTDKHKLLELKTNKK
jgi:DNA polymerase II small subunit/DNA polymerase delta subunit B